MNGNGMFLLLIGTVLGGLAQMKVKSAYARASQIPANNGLTGAEIAKRIMADNGITDVGLEQVAGTLSDHYDPKAKVVRLSADVYGGTSLAAQGIAAHEIGHVIQHAKSYSMLQIRNIAVPLASVAPTISYVILGIGAAANSIGLITLAVLLYSAVAIFQIVNLPVEFDASRRAKVELDKMGLVTGSELEEVDSVLDAAALTYVAATVSAVLMVLQMAIQYGLLGGRRNEQQ